MARPIWSGAISFGLVNVPVKLFTAVRKKTVRFHQLHANDGARIQQRRFCSVEGVEVSYEDLAKGYELYPGQYVMIDPDELDSLDPVATQTIDIEDFVSLDEIDPLYYDTTYYLAPDPRGTKAYRLLLDAMRDSGRVGIARVVLRTKQYLCAVRPVGELLALTTMNFADEIVAEEEIEAPEPAQAPSERELTMARQLIDSLTTEFQPDRYHDTYREQVLALIEAKAEGQELVSQPAAAPAPVIDLMAALEASLAGSKGARPAGGAEAKAGGEESGGDESGAEEADTGRRSSRGKRAAS
ncbi:MAG TPA: Ku protein [Acidimicrobiales bacterium]|nr:Ku protein [Acidimicrobiales bacterium]